MLSDQDAWYSELDNSAEIKKGIILLLKHTLKFSKKYKLKLVISLKRPKNHDLGESFFVEEQNFFKDNLTTNEYLFAKKSFFNKKNKYNWGHSKTMHNRGEGLSNAYLTLYPL